METMHLIGSEQVERAAYAMRSAAEAMERAAGNMDGTAERLIRALDEAATRIERAVEAFAAGVRVARVGPEGWRRLVESLRALGETDDRIKELAQRYGLDTAGVALPEGGQKNG